MIGPSRWQIRCLKCGLTRRAEDAGITRFASASRVYTLAWCSRCRWLRRAVIEPTPERGFDVIVPAPALGGGGGEAGG